LGAFGASIVGVRIGAEALWVVLEELLVWEELSALMDYAQAREGDFRSSGVVAGSDPAYRDHRRSRVLLDAGPFHGLISERIRFYFDRIVRALGLPHLEVSRVESQITASGDGDYFRLHDDNTRGCPPSREVSYVYFFHREPKPFQGGELVLHGAEGAAMSVVPAQNEVVFFPSACLHEVLPVRCPTGSFADSRFTVNGWVHRSLPARRNDG
jgi:Rps23 Pro-64 3,4-dihydroxylase Tpa1-like proline 4-hydroxylase